MAKELTEKQIHNKLDKYYKEYYGDRDTDEWFVNPAPNVWKFIRDEKTIILEYNYQTGQIIER